jgi:hypothetical protein
MNSVKIFKLSLTTTILLLTFLAYRSSASANPSSSALHPSGLGPFIEIWDDDVQNNWPAVAYNPQAAEYMVVWFTEQDIYTTDIQARRVLANGTLSSWFTVDSSPGVKFENPAIAYCPPLQEYMVVYTDDTSSTDSNIYARTFSWNGSTISARLDIDTSPKDQEFPVIAYSTLKNEFLIVYDSRNSLTTTDIVARRYRLSDHTLLPPVTIASSAISHYRYSPDVAYNPARNTYFIIYVLEDNSTGTIDSIVGLAASFDLANLSPEVDIASGSSTHNQPAIATGPDGYLVTYSSFDYIYARLVGGDGVPIGPANGFPIPNAPEMAYYWHPDVAYLGSATYLVTWFFHDITTPDHADIFAQYVNAETGSLKGANIPVDISPNWQGFPSVACTPVGDCLVAYEHNAFVYPGGDWDIRGRMVSTFKTYIPLAKK